MNLWSAFASLLLARDGSASAVPLSDHLDTAANCSTKSAAAHNLTVYGAEILYTPANATVNTTGLDTTTSFEFQLFNAVLGVDAQCSTHVSQTYNSNEWHTCFVESRDTRIAAAFRFDLGRQAVTINETWVCDDDGGGTSSFEAAATNSIDLLCTETVDTGTGQHYCARVASGPFPVNVKEVVG
ncbi:hypothetical protein Sste5346_002432 [Sporothrix stenoceras]|uniref:AA1-like domain-containing protein n=1 Tax=Sporothrix stenoceras TaxID=5173 RepID=A0ABR3ZKR8_9PEZI